MFPVPPVCCQLATQYAEVAKLLCWIDHEWASSRPIYSGPDRQLGRMYSLDLLEAAFVDAVQLMPADANAHYNLGVELDRLGRHSDAAKKQRVLSHGISTSSSTWDMDIFTRGDMQKRRRHFLA